MMTMAQAESAADFWAQFSFWYEDEPDLDALDAMLDWHSLMATEDAQ